MHNTVKNKTNIVKSTLEESKGILYNLYCKVLFFQANNRVNKRESAARKCTFSFIV